jgi:hypothetical protein
MGMTGDLTLVLLRDGTYAPPGDCKRDDNDAVIKHEASGIPVALYEDGTPQTLGQDAINNKNVDAALAGDPNAETKRKEWDEVDKHGKEQAERDKKAREERGHRAGLERPQLQPQVQDEREAHLAGQGKRYDPPKPSQQASATTRAPSPDPKG